MSSLDEGVAMPLMPRPLQFGQDAGDNSAVLREGYRGIFNFHQLKYQQMGHSGINVHPQTKKKNKP